MKRFALCRRSPSLPRLPAAMPLRRQPPSPSTRARPPGSIDPQIFQQRRRRHGDSGYALVREEREFTLKARAQPAARERRPGAHRSRPPVAFASAHRIRTGTRVVEQNFEFDLTSTAKLLSRYLDREITVEQARGTGRGVRSPARSSARRAASRCSRPTAACASCRATRQCACRAFPGGLISKPTLVWDIDAGDRRRAQVALRLPDGRHDLVDRLQPHLLRAQAAAPARWTWARGSRS